MRHYIAYHKVEEYGEYRVGGTDFGHYSRHPVSKLKKMIGETVWVVSGERILGKMVYKLCSVYIPNNLEEDEYGVALIGTGYGFVPHVELSSFTWLSELLKEQNKFSYGLNQIKSQTIITGLDMIRRSHIAEESLLLLPDEIDEAEKYPEGAKKQITVNAYERNTKARAGCIAYYSYNCSVCGMNFQEAYGEIGAEYIHVHHIKPVSEIAGEYQVNPIEDLRPVCPNCHAMLHRKSPPYSLDEIKTKLRKAK